MAGGLPALTPLGTVFYDPVGERPLETNVSSRLLRLNPLVFQDLFPLSLEFAV